MAKLTTTFRGEGSRASGPFSPRWWKGFFVCFFRPSASAWHARVRPPHLQTTALALLLGSAGGLRAPPAAAAGNGQPVYETVVTAPVAAEQTPREDRAASATVITPDRTPRAAETVTELLAEQAGAVVTRLGGLGSTATLSLRGSTANQVLVYVDGVPLNSATGGGVDLGAIPLDHVERIEIYRGMTPIGFGASAIGGVVSVSTMLPKENRVDLEGGGGSFGTYYGSGRAAWNRGRFHLYAGAHALGSNGDFPYLDDNGSTLTPTDDEERRRSNNDLRQLDGMVRAALDLPGHRQLRLSLMLFDRAQGLPGLGWLADPDARLGTRRATATLAYEANGDAGLGGRLRATVYGNYLFTHFVDLQPTINVVRTDARDRTYTAGGTVDWRGGVRDWLTLAAILDGRHDRFTPSDPIAPDPSGAPGTRLFGAAGLEGDFWVRPWRLDVIASLRLEVAREQTSGRDDLYALQATSAPVNHLLPMARLSFIETVTTWLSLRANAGRYARLPSLIELYGNTGYLLGNADLRPESGYNADVGPQITWHGPRARIDGSAAFFASWVGDLIAYQIGGGRARPDNVGSARILGIESSATLALGPHARLVASATFTEARDTTTRETYAGKQLAMRPRYRFYARPEWRGLALGTSVSLGLYADVDATAGNFLHPANTLPVSARLLLGAGIYATLPAHFCLRLSARNLADARVHDLANYPLPGRELYLSLAWSSADPTPMRKE